MAHRYVVFVKKASLNRGHQNKVAGVDELAWIKHVIADNRSSALDKCLPEIRRKVLPRICDTTIRYISVFVGQGADHGSCAASRLQPIQVDSAGNRRS